MWTMPIFSGGNTELTAEMLNTVLEYVRKQGRIIPSPEVAVDQTPDGWMLRLASPLGWWGRLGGRDGNRYAWGREELLPDGTFYAHPSRQFGTTESRWAEEVNGIVCPPDLVVWLEPSGDATGRLSFAAPVTDGSDRSVFWARITDAAAGGYGYDEVEATAGGFTTKFGGRSARAGNQSEAVEAGGATGVPVGSVVLMFDFSRQNHTPPPPDRVVFRYGAALARWARLSGRTTNTIYSVALGGTRGYWTATVTDLDGDISYSAVVPGDATAAVVQAELHAAYLAGLGAESAEELTRVTQEVTDEGSGSTFRVEFLEALGGGRRVRLVVDATTISAAAGESLSPAALGEGEEAEGGSTGAVTVGRVQTGRDDPYTNGRGGYGWYEVLPAGGDSLTFSPAPDGLASDWPFGAAYEVGGREHVPEGSIVRIYPGPSVTLPDRDLPDGRWLFRYGGDTGRWAMIGAAASWTVNLGRPTAGMWVLRWDESGRNLIAVRRNTSLSVGVRDDVATATIGWNKAVPTRVFVSGHWVTSPVVTTGVTVALPATADAIRAALEARYPQLAGNLTVGGGPLGTVTTSTDDTDPCHPVTVKAGVRVTIEMTGDLAECHNTGGFTISTPAAPPVPSGTVYTNMTATSVAGSGSRALLPYTDTAEDLRNGSRVLNLLPDTFNAGVLASRPVPPVRPPSPDFDGQTLHPFTLDAAGFASVADVPDVTIVSFLQYGDDGTEEGEPSVTGGDPIPSAGEAAPLGRGVYHACVLEPHPVGGAVLVPARRDGRITVATAVESDGRDDVPATAIVRLWSSGRADYAPGATEPVPERWAFNGPSAGFWGRIAAAVEGGYEVVPQLSAWGRLRYVVASETGGNTSVPVGTVAWIRPTKSGHLFTLAGLVYDTVAAVVYAGPAGVYADEPAANGYVYWSGASARCVIETDGDPLFAGGIYAGLYLRTAAAAAGGTLPVYQVESPFKRAAGGGLGGLNNASQLLGSGDKVCLGGQIAFAAAGAGGPAAGDAMPTGVKWGVVGEAAATFVGSTAASGRRWGFRTSGTGLGEMVRAEGTGGTFYAAAGAASTTLRVTVPVAGSPAAQVLPTVPCLAVIGGGNSPYELITITRCCPVPSDQLVPPAANVCDFTVVRNQGGSGVVTPDVGYGWATAVVHPQTFGPSRMTFWTDQAAFACDGTAGGSGTLTVPGLHPTMDMQLTFAGGVLTAIGSGPGSVVYGNTQLLTGSGFTLCDTPGSGFPDYHGATTVGLDIVGRVSGIALIP